MKELALNILDIAQNSVKAGAGEILVSVTDGADGLRTLTIRDDGCGMEPDFLAAVTDPFTTTRTTRPVGLGLPLLKLAAEQTGGTMTVESRHVGAHPEDHGTCVTATFRTDHVDCEPLGDYASTVITLLQGSPDLHWTFLYTTPRGEKRLDTDEMRGMLGEEVPMNEPAVLVWAREYWEEPFEEEPSETD